MRFQELMEKVGTDRGDGSAPELPMHPEKFYIGDGVLYSFRILLPFKHYSITGGTVGLTPPARELWLNHREEFFALHALLK